MAVILTTLPLMAVIWYDAQREFERESLALEQEVQRLTAFITGSVNHLMEETRQVLIAVDAIYRAMPPETSRSVLANLAEQHPYYTQFGVVPVPREMRHPGPPDGTASEAITDQFLARAAESGKLVIGNLHARLPGDKDLLTVAFRVPVASNASPPSIAFAVLDQEWLDALLEEERVTGTQSLFPKDMVLNIMDRSGTILTRHPDKAKWAGKRFPDSEILHEIIRKGVGSADLVGVTGQRRLYAFKSVAAVSGDIMVSIGVSREAALASAKHGLRRSLAGVSAVALLLILGAWFGTGLFITRPVAALVEATQRLGSGDLNARAGAIRGPREIVHLAEAFDRMAGTLHRAAQEQERMQTELAVYDRELRSMSVEIALAEERERQQIAAGLHDKAGPLLATCYMKLGRALKLPAPPEITAALNDSRALIDQAVGELRSLTFDLSSPALYALGLPAAVEELCQDTAKHHSLEIVFQDQGTPKSIPNDQRVVLYRAARELLLNVVKHAEAMRATIVCGGDAEEVFVSVTDDGVGFDAAGAGSGFSRTGGFGLFNLHERLAHLGGRLTVESSRGTGTRVVAALPVQPHATSEEREEPHGNQSLSG